IAATWVERLRRGGADPLPLETGERTGAEGERTRDALAAWTAAVDCAVVGLGTCGSCTMWSVRDAIGVEQLAKPVVAAICEEFISHARTTAEFLGHPHLKLLVLPYPLEARPDAELRAIADEHYPRLLELIGVTA
ncbi:MAG: UGSC family (seleno)protein, partial [Candidatus Binatia bacterium]